MLGAYDQDSDSSSDEEPEHTACLLVGRSSTGKSSLVRTILKQFKDFSKPCYIVNDRNRKTSKFVRISFPQLLDPDLHHATVVVEDIVNATPAQFRILAEVLNVGVHHRRLSPTICVTHSVIKQNIHALLPFFTRIYFSGCKSSIPSLRNVLQHFGFQKEEKEFHVRNLIANKTPWSHYVLHVDQLVIEKVQYPFEEGSDDEEDGKKGKKKKKMHVSAREALTQKNALRYFSVLKNSKEAMACWDLIYCKLEKRNIDPHSLEITLQTKGGKRAPVTISLISYVAALVDTDGKVPASHEIAKFHQYCQTEKAIKLPSVFVLNRGFR
jgi:GTPase SAR1 family protein